MSRIFQGGSNRDTVAAAGISASPLTIVAWMRKTDATQSHLGLEATGGGSYWAIENDGTNGQCSIFNASSAQATQPWIADHNWHHIAAVFTSTVSRQCFVDGAGGTANATSIADFTAVATELGDHWTGAAANSNVHQVAHVAIYKVALSALEIKTLALGARPDQVQAVNLVGYWPMTSAGGRDLDLSTKANNTTITGTVFSLDNPPVTPPAWNLQRLLLWTSGAPPAFVWQDISYYPQAQRDAYEIESY